SISTLFQASLFPGLLVAALLLITAFVIAWMNPKLGPAGSKSSWQERFRSLDGVLQVVILFLIAIGGMLLGWFTPTEAAGVGAFGAVVITWLTRSLTWEKFWRSIIDTLRTSAVVVLLVPSPIVFGRLRSLTRLPRYAAGWLSQLSVAPAVVLLIVIWICPVGGALMDAMCFLVISTPTCFPLLVSLGYGL